MRPNTVDSWLNAMFNVFEECIGYYQKGLQNRCTEKGINMLLNTEYIHNDTIICYFIYVHKLFVCKKCSKVELPVPPAPHPELSNLLYLS